MKVKGFQVAPAELEGCLLDHPDVADTCVVPIPDTYSGELPMAFVVLHPNAAKKVASNPAEVERVKASIKKVELVLHYSKYCLTIFFVEACRRQQGCI
jgi:acyl-CoA synthetase (AMP-forming)/AMP-acid ligase II